MKIAARPVSQRSIEKIEPENYTVGARHHMLKVIEQKVSGGDIVAAYEQHEEMSGKYV